MTLPAPFLDQCIERLKDLPRPKQLTGKVILTIEVSFGDGGQVTSVFADTSVRERLFI